MIRALNLPAAIAAIIAICAPAQAATFLYSGTLDSYSVSGSGLYGFTVAGAQGRSDPFTTVGGGGGAVISGDLYLKSGMLLTILVGGAGAGIIGSDDAGGGMSFIALGTTPLIVAGGGGGSNWFLGSGGAGQIGTSGQSSGPFQGGTDGQGAAAGAARAKRISSGDARNSGTNNSDVRHWALQTVAQAGKSGP